MRRELRGPGLPRKDCQLNELRRELSHQVKVSSCNLTMNHGSQITDGYHMEYVVVKKKAI